MEAAMKEDYGNILEEQSSEVRKMVLDGLEQIKVGKSKNFNEVRDRLERKSSDRG